MWVADTINTVQTLDFLQYADKMLWSTNSCGKRLQVQKITHTPTLFPAAHPYNICNLPTAEIKAFFLPNNYLIFMSLDM